ncbi:MAG: hypothetical protein AAF449_00385 [Myxococcota bacterium]
MNLMDWLNQPAPNETIEQRRVRRDQVHQARAKAFAGQMKRVVAVHNAVQKTRDLDRSAAELARSALWNPDHPMRHDEAAKAQRKATRALRAEERLTRPMSNVWGWLGSLLKGQPLLMLDQKRPATVSRPSQPQPVFDRPSEQPVFDRPSERLAELKDAQTTKQPDGLHPAKEWDQVIDYDQEPYLDDGDHYLEEMYITHDGNDDDEWIDVSETDPQHDIEKSPAAGD